jgi:hypothetical protein
MGILALPAACLRCATCWLNPSVGLFAERRQGGVLQVRRHRAEDGHHGVCAAEGARRSLPVVWLWVVKTHKHAGASLACVACMAALADRQWIWRLLPELAGARTSSMCRAGGRRHRHHRLGQHRRPEAAGRPHPAGGAPARSASRAAASPRCAALSCVHTCMPPAALAGRLTSSHQPCLPVESSRAPVRPSLRLERCAASRPT